MPSEKQMEIFDFIRAHTARTGRPPTMEEIRYAKGLSSKSLVVHHLKASSPPG